MCDRSLRYEAVTKAVLPSKSYRCVHALIRIGLDVALVDAPTSSWGMRADVALSWAEVIVKQDDATSGANAMR